MGDRRRRHSGAGAGNARRGDKGGGGGGGRGGGEDDWLNPMKVLDSINSMIDGVRCCTTEDIRQVRRASEWEQVVHRGTADLSGDAGRIPPRKLVHMRFSQESESHLQSPAFTAMSGESRKEGTALQPPAQYKVMPGPKDYDAYSTESSTNSTVSAWDEGASSKQSGDHPSVRSGGEAEAKFPEQNANMPPSPVKFEIQAATMDRQLKEDLKLWGNLGSSWKRSMPSGSFRSTASFKTVDSEGSPRSPASSQNREEVL